MLATHGVQADPMTEHVKAYWIGDGISIHQLSNGKLDINMVAGPRPDEIVHVMRRYKNGKGWFDDDFADKALDLLAKFMVLDDLASI